MAFQSKDFDIAHAFTAMPFSRPDISIPVMNEDNVSSRLNSYDQAFDALCALKVEPKVVDLVYDDRIISRLCQLSRSVTEKLTKKHADLHLGNPTEETIDRALSELEDEGLFGPYTDSF